MRVAFIGNIVGNAYLWAKLLRRQGLEVDLFLRSREVGRMGPAWEDGELAEAALPEWIRIFESTNEAAGHLGPAAKTLAFLKAGRARRPLLRELLGYDLIHSFTGSLFFSPTAVWRFGLRRARPYLACATGSDIREVAVRHTPAGLVMRLFFKRAARTLLLNLDMVDLSQRLGLSQAEFFPFLIDVEKYSPAQVPRRYGREEDLLFFMPSRLDWGEVDDAPGRSSTKGNDRFLRAAAAYIKKGGRAHLVLVDYGADREEARRLVSALGLSERVTFLPKLKKDELIEHYRMADVVADQFDVGAFGTVGLEAMACGKPLLIYIDDSAAQKCYPQRPPILNARSEKEIFEQIQAAVEESHRAAVGRAARDWIMKHHHGDTLARRLTAMYEEILEGQP